MDAAENELRLQRLSGNLLSEFEALLPKYLWASNVPGGYHVLQKEHICRRFVNQNKTDKLIKLLEPFQEWPQLIDPYLNRFVQMLVSAFLDYLCFHRECYALLIHKSSEVIPLPRGICRILYTLCKVRGQKVVSQLLNNEAKYVDGMVLAFRDWNGTQATALVNTFGTCQDAMIWEEKYIMLVWLSHLLLTPFDLESISSLDGKDIQDGVCPFSISSHLPPAVRMILNYGQNLSCSGKEREAAKLLLVRLALRPDMRKFHILESLMKWSLLHFQASDVSPQSIYVYVGVLSFIDGVLASHERSVVAPFVTSVFEVLQGIVAQESAISRGIFSSALGRKLLVKLFCSVTLQTLHHDSSGLSSNRLGHVEEVLLITVDQLLNFLTDKETLVRCAASKALSKITIALEPSLAIDIIEAIISGLDEDVLWEVVDHGQMTSHDDVLGVKPGRLKRNLTAVSPLRWHGLVLTLSYLIYRRLPPTGQLSGLLNALILALGFEQRSSSGSSVGTNVRDAACFGLWALARVYSTEELMAVDISSIHVVKEQTLSTSILHVLSCELLAAATLDPSGNIRRGASAALQELIGRHPDIIAQGIPLVQMVDSQGVSSRSRAMIEVAVNAARLNHLYRRSIVEGLLGWRGAGSPDAPSRRYAASAVGLIATSGDQDTMESMIAKVYDRLRNLQSRQIEVRHGLLYSLAMIFREAGAQLRDPHYTMSPVKFDTTGHWNIFRSVCPLRYDEFNVTASQSHITADAACRLVSALCFQIDSIYSLQGCRGYLHSSSDLDSCINVLNWSLLLTREEVTDVSSSTANQLFSLLDPHRRESLVQSWAGLLKNVKASSGSNSASAIGHLAALGAVAHHVSATFAVHTIIRTLLSQIDTRTMIELRVAAVRSLSNALQNLMTMPIIEALQVCLDDYTNDQRGDIGSQLRLQAIECIDIALQHCLLPEKESRQALIARICRLAGEKLDKVRIRAWRCMQDNWTAIFGPEILCVRFDDADLMSTPEYYKQLLALRSIEWLRRDVLEGCISSAGAGSEAVIRSARAALAGYVDLSSALETANLFSDLLSISKRRMTDDRFIVPAFAVFAFLLDSGAFDGPSHQTLSLRSFFGLVQTCHYRSSNIPKLTITVRIYSSLARREELQREAIDKLCRMLLHPFPVVRNAAADGLFLETSLDELQRVRWADTPRDLKMMVQDIRRRLGVERSNG